jgi:hypothetical protein
VIQRARSDGVRTPFCVGISGKSLEQGFVWVVRNYLWSRSGPLSYPVPCETDPCTQKMFIYICIDTYEPPSLNVDVVNERIKLRVPLIVDVIEGAGRRPGDGKLRIARARAVAVVETIPSINIHTTQTLQLTFHRGELENDAVDVHIIDPSTILDQFSTLPHFVNWAEEFVRNISNGIGTPENFFPMLISSTPLPKQWLRTKEYEGYIHNFEYRLVSQTLEDGSDGSTYDIEYLFLVLSLRSLNLPCACLCDDQIPTKQDAIVTTKSNPSTWFSLAFSQEAIEELARPYKDHRGRDGSGQKDEGLLFWETFATWRVTWGTINILSDRLRAPIDIFSSRAGARAGLKERYTNLTILEENVGVSFTVDRARVDLVVSELQDFPYEGSNSIVLRPQVDIDPTNINVRVSSPFGDLIDAATSYVFRWFTVTLVSTLIFLHIQSRIFLHLMYEIRSVQRGEFRLDYIGSEFEEDQSIVLIGNLSFWR